MVNYVWGGFGVGNVVAKSNEMGFFIAIGIYR